MRLGETLFQGHRRFTAAAYAPRHTPHALDLPPPPPSRWTRSRVIGRCRLTLGGDTIREQWTYVSPTFQETDAWHRSHSDGWRGTSRDIVFSSADQAAAAFEGR